MRSGVLGSCVVATVLVGCGGADSNGFDDAPTDQWSAAQRSAATAEVFAEFGDDTPGCAVGVEHPHGTHLDGFGMADLDAPVSEYVDDLGNSVDGVIVADLVHHTSGLPDYGDLFDADDEITTNGDVVDVLAAAAAVDGPDFDPGTEFEYSNSNYVLRALLVEGVTGRSFVDVSNDLIFDPLDMDATVVRDDQGTLLDGQARGYVEAADGDWEPVGSSAWRGLMLTGGEVDDDGVPYGFGIGIEDGGGTLTHSGSWVGCGSVLTVRPDEGTAVAIACNIDGHDVEAAAAEVLAIWQ